MIGRLLAACGWLAWQVGRPFGRGPVRAARRGIVAAVAVACFALAGVPVAVPLLDPQPEDLGAESLFAGEATAEGTWIRLDGRIVPLRDAPTGSTGRYALLIDAARPLRAVVVRAADHGAARIEATERTLVTGRIEPATVLVDEELPIEATVAGTPPQVLADRLLVLDPVPKPVRHVPWALGIPPALMGLLLLVGSRVGYPIFRAGSVVDVLSSPLGPGERLPSAYGGRIGPNSSELTDPAGVLLLVRRGAQGNLLTAQPLPEDGGPAPAPVTIGGGWSSGRTGEVHTVTETVPALRVRSELVDATFLFARPAERDCVAALVTVDR